MNGFYQVQVSTVINPVIKSTIFVFNVGVHVWRIILSNKCVHSLCIV